MNNPLREVITMKCENYWCKHWNCNECNIAPNIHLDEDEYLESVIVDIEDIKELMDLGYIASGGALIGYLELMLSRKGN